ncbi:MAG: SurA N-terminal domain-containing protein [Candidatus Promineifilaceae bacterium]
MTKKRKQSEIEQQRQSRKEILLARKQHKQTRQIRLAVGGVIALLVVVFGIGLVNELVVKPTQPVASVNGVEISLKDWQDRVRFQRAQLIIGIEDLEQTVGGDIGLVQQFAGQQMNLLLQPDVLGQLVLDDMIDDQLIRQTAAVRGIEVTDDDVEKRIEENFNYYGGESPTPFPTSTATVMPTPSITPFPTDVITDVVPTNTPAPSPTAGPTASPPPTATAVSLESFQGDFTGTLDRFESYGVSEATYRDYIRGQLYRERLTEVLADEQGFLTEDEQVSFYYLAFDTEEEAQATQAMLDGEDFLTVWNMVRSRPADPESTDTATASEILWRRQDALVPLFGEEVASAAFDLEIGETSDVLVDTADTEGDTDHYYILDVSGREVRPLSDSVIQQEKDDLMTNWLQGEARSNVQNFDLWQTNVPQQPTLDPRFLVQPTEAAPQPTIAIPEVPTVDEGQQEQ